MDIETLARRFVAHAPKLDEEEQSLSIALYRLLAEGRPVGPSAVAARAVVPLTQVEEALDRWTESSRKSPNLGKTASTTWAPTPRERALLSKEAKSPLAIVHRPTRCQSRL